MSEYTPPATQSHSPSVYRVEHDSDDPAALSTTVVHALADCMGIDVTDSRLSLYDAVDPDALDSLFRPCHDGTPRNGGTLSFPINGYHVTVDSSGEILIKPPETGRYQSR